MKKLRTIPLFLLLMSTFFVASAQQKVPQGVAFNFSTMYPLSMMEKVYTDTLSQVYIYFKNEGNPFISRYSKEGYWQFSGAKLSGKSIPKELNDYVTQNMNTDTKGKVNIYAVETPFQKNIYFVEIITGNKNKHFLMTEQGVVLGY